MSNEVMDLVQIMNDQVVTTSLKVAECFPEKRHSDIILSIEKAIISQRKFSSAKNAFQKSTYCDKQGKPRPMYYLNRDGFSFIVMGFTGDKAAEFKWKFIEAFNKMENQLKYGSNKVPQTFLEALEYERLCA